MRAISNKMVIFYLNLIINNKNDIPILERLADLPPQIRDTPHQKMLINHTDASKGEIKRYR